MTIKCELCKRTFDDIDDLAIHIFEIQECDPQK